MAAAPVASEELQNWGKALVNLRSRAGFSAHVCCQPGMAWPFVLGTKLQGPPLPGAGGHSPAPSSPAYSWLYSLDLRGKTVFSEALPDEVLSPPGQQLTASRTQPRKSSET